MSHSDDSQVLLAPSFKPPKPVEFQRTSEHNKIGILLALRPAFSTDRSKGHHSQSLEWAAGYDKKVCNTKSAVSSVRGINTIHLRNSRARLIYVILIF